MTFEEFAADRLGAVLRFAAVLAGERALAEDVVQEVLIRAHARWDLIGTLDLPEAYVRKMIVNEYLSWRRRSWRLVPSGDLEADAGGLGRDHAVDHAERDALLTEVGRLPRRQKAVLVLRYYEALTDAEIAEVLGCTPGTVRGYASRALATLRVDLSREPSEAAMLTAFESIRGDVEYETQISTAHGVLADEYRTWTWPAQPVPGHRQLSRTLYRGRSPASAAVKLAEDRGIEAVTPPDITGLVRGQVTIVCFAGSGQTGCGYGERNTLAGTWSRFTALAQGGSDIGSGGFLDPSLLARGVVAGAWRVVGRAHLDGQPAIELKEAGYRKGIPESLPGELWVNAHTYLPIRLIMGTTLQDFYYLPPTPANLALLQVPIPPGYPRR